MSHALPPLPRCILNRSSQHPTQMTLPALPRATQMTLNMPHKWVTPEIQTARRNSPIERAAYQIKLSLEFQRHQTQSQNCSLMVLLTVLLEVGIDLRVQWFCLYFAHSLHQNCVECVHTIITCTILIQLLIVHRKHCVLLWVLIWDREALVGYRGLFSCLKNLSLVH